MEVGSSQSVPSKCAIGVPEGFKFGPILLIIFINDLFDSYIDHTSVFADDTNEIMTF